MNRNRRLASRIAKILIASSNRLHGPAIDRALLCRPARTDRLIRDTRPHLIGGHGDYVWETGKFSNPPETGLETWFIRGGSAGAALYKFLQPGIYAYVTHNLIEAAELGATAHFKVEGKWNDDLMTQVKAPAEIPAPKTN